MSGWTYNHRIWRSVLSAAMAVGLWQGTAAWSLALDLDSVVPAATTAVCWHHHTGLNSGAVAMLRVRGQRTQAAHSSQVKNYDRAVLVARRKNVAASFLEIPRIRKLLLSSTSGQAIDSLSPPSLS